MRTQELRPIPIEPGILPVCAALNAIPGVETLWSCEGHPYRPSSPYVTFVTSQETAFRIHRLLVCGRDDGRLTYCWWLVANFRDDGSFQYTIKPNDYRLAATSHCLLFPAWRRNTMNQELERLASLLATI